MAKADNMLSILWLLKTGKRITAKQLAEVLEINIRTVYRYIDSLCASGVPIIADSGHNGGYSLLSTFNDTPLIFDLDEQKALLHAAKFAQEAGYPFGEALDQAVSKLKRYTNEDQLNKIDRHLAGFDVINPPADSSIGTFLQVLEVAVADGRTLSITYKKGHEAPPTTRSIDPYGLVYWKGKWYIIAYCQLRSDIRSFRVDRIQAVTRTDATFERPKAFSARDFFLSRLLPDLERKEHLISIHIQGKENAINDLCKHWMIGHAVVGRSANNLHFMAEKKMTLSYLPYTLMSYGKSIKVLEPKILKEKIAAVLSDLLNHYKS
ncbi:putative DNA-binding transcriptional regulator YafY [Scopulibacillus darangshiensis]|uniref:Putative DNA-binding transcriptional regulator YafY n=1 Tax=Scopulibacillus darangshiensis TaxID=442528 RepID=A0A4V2SN58_9BACL|nr:YafY family protein [Scopulibacillus darangshiensis]TCP29986.1 putative DNA-binding transcriptional regulator YafY [Scopulibacillus darangshiensis]